MHETRALWLLVPSVTIHLYNDQYTVRLSGLTETTVSTVMGTMNLIGAEETGLGLNSVKTVLINPTSTAT